MRYDNTASTTKPTINGTWVDYGSVSSSEVKYPYCDIEQTDGMLLMNGSQYANNISCSPHSYNAGNYYNFPAAAAGTSEPASSSICPRGWMLPQNERDTSYSRLLDAYDMDNSATTKSDYDSGLVNLPLSFLRSGLYYNYGSLGSQGGIGYYRMASQSLYFNSGDLNPTYSTSAYGGFSVRCMSR